MSSLDVRGAPLLGLLALAVLFGGGGSPAPLAETVVILGAIAFATLAVILPADRGRRIEPWHWAMALFLPALAMIQLLPIPFELRESLPFGSTLAAVLQAGGSGSRAWPLTINPASTVWSGLSLIPPVVAFLLTLRLAPVDRARVPVAVCGLAMISAVLALLQAASGSLDLYARPSAGGFAGLFANQNSQADLLLIGMCAAPFLPAARGSSAPRHARLAAIWAVMVFATVLTGSRAGLVLMTIPLALLIAIGRGDARMRKRRFLLLGSVGILLIASAFMNFGPFARTGIVDDGRIVAIWPDAMRLAVMAFPWGTGLGTFEHAFPLVESLSVVDATHANRAHSDWLEFLTEAGVFAVLVAGWLAARVAKHMTTLVKSRLACGDLFAFAVLAIVGLHALVDYPFRSLSLAVVSATALGLMLSAERGVANEE